MKGKIRVKSIAIILTFVFLFEYISVLAPLLQSSAVDSTDNNGIEWTYTLSDETATNVAPKNRSEISGDIVVPEKLDGYTVSSFSTSAFYYCQNLTSITIPSGVSLIYTSTFEGCSNLTAINVAEGNTTYASDDGVLFKLDDSATKKVKLIKYPAKKQGTSYSIPETVTTIGSDSFKNCYSLKEIIMQNEVTSIDSSAFYNCSILASIKFSNKLTTIGTSAFVDCIKLTEITIPSSVKSIGTQAFNGCRKLETITFEDGAETVIKSRAFSKSSSLSYANAKVYIPDSITSIESNNFESFWATIYCNQGSTAETYAKTNNIEYVYNETKTGEVDGLGWEYKISNGENAVEVHLISGNYGNVVTIPTKIGDYNVKSIYNSDTTENNIFYQGTDNITKVIIPDGVEKIGDYAFYNCKNLKEVEIPSSLTTIGKSAFEGCSSLENITIPNKVTSIGASAFADCTNLKTITIPTSVKTIGSDILKNCNDVTIFCYEDSVAHKYATNNNIDVILIKNIRFTDKNLYEKVKEELERQNIEIKQDNSTNQTIVIDNDELEKIRSLNLSNAGIKNLSGIQFFIDLEELDISGNSFNKTTFSDSDLGLTSSYKNNLSALKKINLSNNNLRAVEFKYLTNLKELNLSNNQILTITEDTFEVSNTLESLNLSNNKLTSFRFDNLENLKTLILNNNKITDIDVQNLNNLETLNLDNNCIKDNYYFKSNYLVDLDDDEALMDDYPFESNLDNLNVSMKNQTIEEYAIQKEITMGKMPKIIREATTNKYSNGTTVTYDTVNCEINGDKVTFSDSINSTDTFATIEVKGGQMDGTVCTLKPADYFNIETEIDNDQLKLKVKLGDTDYKSDIYLRYSLDGSEYEEYKDKITLSEGAHNIRVKLFDNELLNFDTDEVKTNLYAIRKNGKVYIYSSTHGEKQYSFEREGTYEKYTGPIENNDSEKVYVKLDEGEIKEVTIQNTSINNEDEYNLYDTKKGEDSMPIAVRKNGKIYIDMPDNINTIKYSYDMHTWNETSQVGRVELNDIGSSDIYIKYYTVGSDTTNINTSALKVTTENELSEIYGVYKENGNNYIFSQERTDEVQSDDRLQIINDENKIKKSNQNILSMTKAFEQNLALKDDGCVYKITYNYQNDEYDFQMITGGTNIKRIGGVFAVDNQNNIWKYEFNNDTFTYSKCTEFTIDGTIEKIYSIISENTMIPYVLYEDGRAVILNVDGSINEISNQAIDIAVKFDEDAELYALEFDKVVVLQGKMSRNTVDITNCLDDDEIPLKINNQGSILTNKENMYIGEFEYNSIPFYSYEGYLLNSYSKTNVKTGIKKLGDNTYQDTNKNTYYMALIPEVKSENVAPSVYINKKIYTFNFYQANKLITDITVTKDESKLAESKVKINVEIPENKYTVKLPDGSTTNKSTTYDVTENGVYAFEFTDLEGYTSVRVVHITNIQSRKETKIPEATVVNGKVKLNSDDEIEYSVDEKNTWTNYSQEITYEKPIYARIKNNNYECSIIKITIDESGKLEVTNEESREIQGEILTNAIGDTTKVIYNNKNKEINIAQEVAVVVASTGVSTNKTLFEYISQIADNIIYSFSTTDGEYAGCYFENNTTEITYKDINNDVISLNDESSFKNIAQTDNYIDYAVIKNNYGIIESAKLETISDITDEKIDQLSNEVTNESKNLIAVQKQNKSYAYIDNQGNLVSNIEIINKAKKQIGEDTKYVKIVGDGVTFYILTQEGEVYAVTEADNGTYGYFSDKLRTGDINCEPNTADIIYKLEVRNIIDIYDSCTALTKDGDVISLIKDESKGTSAVQELEKQTDKYLVATHLGLKNGKLYNFNDVQNGTEVTKGKIVKQTSRVGAIGIYSEKENKIKLFDRDEKYDLIIPDLAEGESYITVEELNEDLPEFIDIAENRDEYLTRLAFEYGAHTANSKTINYDTADKYAKCYAITTTGEVYAYLNGYAVDTGINLNFFGPTANYDLNNSNWTKENINLKLSANTTNEIVQAEIKKKENTVLSFNKSAEETLETRPLEVQTNGIYSYTITDAKGKSFSGVINVGNIDKLKPNNPVLETKDGKMQIIYKDDKEATEDYAKSGIKENLYSLDGNTWTKANTDVILLDVNEDAIVYAKSVDNAGNESDTVTGSPTIETGKVTVKYQDINGQTIKENKVLSGKVGQEYTVEKETIANYEFVEAQGELTGLYTKDEKIVILKYKSLTGKVTVKYVDENNKNIKDDVILTGNIGEDYKTEKVDFEIYDFVEVQGNEEGKFTKEDQEVIYKYNKKNGRVIIIYEDPDGNSIKDNDIITDKIDEPYSVDRQIIDGYELIEIIGNEKGKYKLEDQYVRYKYKKIECKVTVKYVDENNKNIKDDVILTGNIGESYKAEKVDFEVYDFVEVQGNEQGIFTKEDQEVIYKYNKRSGRVIIIYEDPDGTPIRDNDIITDKVGEPYSVDRQEIDGYEITEVIGNEKGEYKLEDQYVTYKYKKIECKVTVKYVDENNNRIKDDVILTGNIGENYKTEKVDFEIYEFVEVQGNEKGKFTKEEQEVIYKYNKKNGRIIIIYQDPDGKPIKDNDIITGKIGEPYSVDRKIIDGYELIEIIGNEKGNYQLADQFVMYKYKKIEKPVTIPQTGQSRIAYIAIGIIIIISICSLIYFKRDEFNSNK